MNAKLQPASPNAYSFTAGADYRVYPATITGFSGGSVDTLIDLIASDGTAVLETNDEAGAIGSATDISETVLMLAGTYSGTYYVRVRPLNTVSLFGSIRPYDFYVRVLSGSRMAPRAVLTAEAEPSEQSASRAVLSAGPANAVIGPPIAEHDTFAIAARGADLIAALVGIDPQRDTPEWQAMAGVGAFNGSFIMVNGGRTLR